MELGYGRTTTNAIAAEAGFSRGAMLHHFPTRADAIHASVEAVFRKRLQVLARGLAKHGHVGADRNRALLQVLWFQLRDRSFLALVELGIAARTDRELARLLAPAEEAYGRAWRELTRAALAANAGSTTAADDVLDTTRAALEGLALASARSTDDPPALRGVLRQLERVLGPTPG